MSCLKLTLPAFALVGAVLCNPMSSFAARGVRVSLNPSQETENTATGSATNDETVQVNGRGLGTTKDAAIKDAFRDAIERTIGLYVDAETVAKNDEIVKDQILTHSNAYVKDYKEIKSGNAANGLIEVRILATIQRRALTAKLTDIMPTQTVKLGGGGLQSAFAQMATQEKRAGDAAALLENALKDLNPVKSLIVANVRPATQKIVTGDQVKMNNEPLPADKVILKYIFELRLDRQKYFSEFMPNLKRVLDQISLSAPKEIRLSELVERDRGSSYASELAKYVAGDEKTCNRLSRSNCGDVILDALHVYSANWGGANHVWEFGNNRNRNFGPKSAGQFSWSSIRFFEGKNGYNGLFSKSYAKQSCEVALVTQMNADCSLGKITLYELDKSTLDVWNKWMSSFVGLNQNQQGEGKGKTFYNIVLTDKNDGELAVFPWEVKTAHLSNIRFAEQPGKGHVYITPFVYCFGESAIEWRNLIVDKSLLPKIDSIKIELAQ